VGFNRIQAWKSLSLKGYNKNESYLFHNKIIIGYLINSSTERNINSLLELIFILKKLISNLYQVSVQFDSMFTVGKLLNNVMISHSFAYKRNKWRFYFRNPCI
jgi:hypothetical protein